MQVLEKKKHQTIGTILNTDENDVDEVLAKTGCKELNDAVLSCYNANNKDWRSCKEEVARFKACFEAYQKQKEKQQIYIK